MCLLLYSPTPKGSYKIYFCVILFCFDLIFFFISTHYMFFFVGSRVHIYAFHRPTVISLKKLNGNMQKIRTMLLALLFNWFMHLTFWLVTFAHHCSSECFVTLCAALKGKKTIKNEIRGTFFYSIHLGAFTVSHKIFLLTMLEVWSIWWPQ